MNSRSDLKETDRELCLRYYDEFKERHDNFIEKLKKDNNIKLLSSFGIN
jgi:hypothetical protein